MEADIWKCFSFVEITKLYVFIVIVAGWSSPFLSSAAFVNLKSDDDDLYVNNNNINSNNNNGAIDSIAYLNGPSLLTSGGRLDNNVSSFYNDSYAFYIGTIKTNSGNDDRSGELRSLPTTVTTLGAIEQSFCEQSFIRCLLLSLVLGVIIITTIVGNGFVIAAVVLERNLQGVANYLIVSLAVADLTVAIMVMPIGAYQEVYHTWNLGGILCDIWTSFDVLSCTASILHLVAIALDRYWAITNVHYGAKRTAKRIATMIIIIWTMATLIAVSPHIFGLSYFAKDKPEKRCQLTNNFTYQLVSTLGAFYLPLVVMCVIYWKIFQSAKFRIRKSGMGTGGNSTLHGRQHDDHRHRTQKQKTETTQHGDVIKSDTSSSLSKNATAIVAVAADTQFSKVPEDTNRCNNFGNRTHNETSFSNWNKQLTSNELQASSSLGGTQEPDKNEERKWSQSTSRSKDKSDPSSSNNDVDSPELPKKSMKNIITKNKFLFSNIAIWNKTRRSGENAAYNNEEANSRLSPVETCQMKKKEKHRQSDAGGPVAEDEALSSGGDVGMRTRLTKPFLSSSSSSSSWSKPQTLPPTLIANNSSSSRQATNDYSTNHSNSQPYSSSSTNKLHFSSVRHRSYDNTSSYQQIISTDNNNHQRQQHFHHHNLNALANMEPKKSRTFVCGVNEDDEHSTLPMGVTSIYTQMSQYLQPDKSLAMYEDSTFNSVSQTRASYAFSENDTEDAMMMDFDDAHVIASSSFSKKNSFDEIAAVAKSNKKISFKEKEKPASSANHTQLTEFDPQPRNHKSNKKTNFVQPSSPSRSSTTLSAYNQTDGGFSTTKTTAVTTPTATVISVNNNTTATNDMSFKLTSSRTSDMIRKRARIDIKRERKAAKTLGVIMTCFIVCWLPFFLMQILFSICSDCYVTKVLQESPLVTILTWSGYLNSLLNPVIYTIFSPDFRTAFAKILFGKYRRIRK